MSSNFSVEKTCQYCNKKFIARTTVTKYCSDKCAKLAYKKRKRDEKIHYSPKQEELSQLYGPDKFRLKYNTKQSVEPKRLLKNRDFFSIAQTSTLLGVSERTLFRMIKRGQILTTKIGGRTLIKKSELLPYFS